MNIGALYHITSNTHNLQAYSEYTEMGDVIVGDGNGIKITHIGHTTLATFSRKFSLIDVLCALAIHAILFFFLYFVSKIKLLLNFPYYFCYEGFENVSTSGSRPEQDADLRVECLFSNSSYLLHHCCTSLISYTLASSSWSPTS